MKNVLTLLILIFVASRGLWLAGDMDRDFDITQNDVNIAMQIAVGRIIPTQYQRIVGDMNRDGRINSADVTLIWRLAQ